MTPNDPRLTFDPQIDRGSQPYAYVCHVTWTSYSIFSANDLLTPVTPNDPRLTFVPIKSQRVSS